MWGPICDSVYESYREQVRLLVKGAQVLSVSLTSLPYPGVGDPKWGLLRACVLGLKYY